MLGSSGGLAKVEVETIGLGDSLDGYASAVIALRE
jgi:hypothetical protein